MGQEDLSNMYKYNRSRSYGSSRPTSGGHFQGQRRNNFRIRSLPNDPSLFIRKSIQGLTAYEQTIQHSFADFNLTPRLKSNITNKGYTTPTPIQDQAINPILEGRDLIGLASTGSGKTAAFLIPLINNLYLNQHQKTLIIVPTRELALQIRDEFKCFAEGMNLYSCIIIGGANINRQVQEIRRSPQVVIATPGRLKDLIQRHIINLKDYSSIVLDEVDLMVDIGFINDIRFFISLMPSSRQSLFFSATIPSKVQGVLQSFVQDPITISVKNQDTSENVDQDVVRVTNPAEKVSKLHDLLVQEEFKKVLIFGRTKHGVEKLYQELTFRGFKIGAIHGNKSQGQRQRALDSFKNDEIQILLATDVASRGLDIDNVTHVINYELPESYEDYIHRIGRTGRAGKMGTALTFIS